MPNLMEITSGRATQALARHGLGPYRFGTTISRTEVGRRGDVALGGRHRRTGSTEPVPLPSGKQKLNFFSTANRHTLRMR